MYRNYLTDTQNKPKLTITWEGVILQYIGILETPYNFDCKRRSKKAIKADEELAEGKRKAKEWLMELARWADDFYDKLPDDQKGFDTKGSSLE